MPTVTHGPIVGATTANSVTIWLRADGPYKAQICLAQDCDSLKQNPLCSAAVQLDKELDCTGVLTLNGLEADTRYYYAVLLNGARVLRDGQELAHPRSPP